MKYEVGVYTGRFQPFHEGHAECIKEGLKEAQDLIIVIGSVDQPSTFKNPFSYKQRYAMIWNWLQDNGLSDRVTITYQKDDPLNDIRWARNLHSKAPRDKTVGLVTHDKGDGSSDWVKLMGWGLINVENHSDINATQIREALYDGEELNHVTNFTENFLEQFKVTDEFYQCVEGYKAKVHNDAMWSGSPYTPIFVATDTIVTTREDEVLLVKRKGPVGKGLWALPGGYLEPDLTLEQNAKKELLEETSVEVPEDYRLSSCGAIDTVGRSLLGRMITNVFLYVVTDKPPIEAGDDAAEVKWFKLKDIKENMMFDDHYHIINRFL